MPSEALSTLRSSLARWKPIDSSGSAQVLPLGISALDTALPEGGLALGAVTELQVRGASGAATSFALAACRAAQQRGGQLESDVWCSFIDPGASLFAPGVTRLGVDLTRLLVTRPAADAVERIAVRIAEANLVSVLVIDLRCLMQVSSTQVRAMQPGSMQVRSINEHSWQRTVRRLSLAVKSSFTSVLLLTQTEQFQSLPLPTFQRLELTRHSQASFELKIAKERTGRISASRAFPCSIFDPHHFNPSAFNPSAFNSSDSEGRRAMGPAEQSFELSTLARKVS